MESQTIQHLQLGTYCTVPQAYCTEPVQQGRRDTFDLPNLDLQQLMASTDTVGVISHLAEYESRESSDGSGNDFCGSFLFNSPSLGGTSVPVGLGHGHAVAFVDPLTARKRSAAAASPTDDEGSEEKEDDEDYVDAQKEGQSKKRHRAASAPTSAIRRARNAQSQHRVRQRHRQAEEEKMAQVAAVALTNSEADEMRRHLLSMADAQEVDNAHLRGLLDKLEETKDFSLLAGLPDLPAAPYDFNPQAAAAMLLPHGVRRCGPAGSSQGTVPMATSRRAAIQRLGSYALPLRQDVAHAALGALQQREAECAALPGPEAGDDVAYRIAAEALLECQGDFEDAIVHLLVAAQSAAL